MRLPNYLSVASFSASAALVSPLWAWAPSYFGSTSHQQRHVFSRSARLSSTSLPVEPSSPGSPCLKKQQVEPKPSLKEKAIAEGTIISHFPGGLTALKINEDLIGDDVDSLSPFLGTTRSLLAPMAFKNSASSGDYQGKKVVFPDGTQGIVVAHRPPLVFCYSPTTPTTAQDGLVNIVKSTANITVSPSIRVVDCFGEPLVKDSGTDGVATPMRPRAIFSPIPGVADIALINACMLTGTTMIDTLAPIGRGQNMLLVGHDIEQMRGLALDFLQTQTRIGNVKCVYACTGTKEEANEAEKRLEGIAGLQFVRPCHSAAARNDKNSDPASRAAAAVVTASTACAIAESYALQEGRHTLVIIDTIDDLKVFWDVTTRVLVDVFGVDAVVQSDRSGGASSEMRGFFSSLIQRSSQYKLSRGGGSVTLLLMATIPSSRSEPDTVFLESDFVQSPDVVKTRIKLLMGKKIPLTAANLLKIGIPIPSASEGKRRMVLQHIDDLMSMSDGQIWLDERLEANGQQPPMDPQRSVTRVGIGADTQSRADAPALRSIAEGLRLDFSQAMSLDGADATSATNKQRRRQNALLLAMYQKAGSSGRRLAESCIALLAAKEGHLDAAVSNGALAGTKKGETLIRNLLDHVATFSGDAMDNIDDTLEISAESRLRLKDAIVSFFEQ